MKNTIKVIFIALFLNLGLAQYVSGNTLPNVISELSPDRIVGGKPAAKGVAPHMVALVIDDGFFRALICGGVVVCKNVVITAAHCITAAMWGSNLNPNLLGVVGSRRWQSTTNNYKFKGYVIHPDYNSWMIKNDIGMLITERPIRMGEFVKPARLNFDWVGGGVASFVTGWGLTGTWAPIPEYLQILKVNTTTPAECIKGVEEASPIAPPIDPKIEICTFHSYGHGMCNGDSGSGLVEIRTDSIIGLVSWGFPCAVGAPDMFVRISPYKGFILLVLRAHCGN